MQQAILEEWKYIQGYEGLYHISSIGRVHSVKSGIYLKGSISGGGYVQVSLTKDRKSKKFNLHRLVAQAFIQNIDCKPQVNHKNGIKNDNCIYNLEWNTSSENVRHSMHVLGTKSNLLGKPGFWTGKLGDKNPFSIPVGKYLNGVLIESFVGMIDAQRITKINRGDIVSCCKGRRKTAGGFEWRYI